MKRVSKIILGIACASIGIGIIIMILSFAIGGRTYYDYHSSYEEEVFDVNSISLDINFGEVTIVKGDRFRIEAENIAEDGIKSYTENNTWFIKEQYNDKETINLFGLRIPITFRFFEIFGFGEDTYPKIVVTIPSDFTADKVTIDVGAGAVFVDELSTKIADFEIGAGSMQIRRLKVSDRIICDVGTGELLVKNLETKDF